MVCNEIQLQTEMLNWHCQSMDVVAKIGISTTNEYAITHHTHYVCSNIIKKVEQFDAQHTDTQHIEPLFLDKPNRSVVFFGLPSVKLMFFFLFHLIVCLYTFVMYFIACVYAHSWLDACLSSLAWLLYFSGMTHRVRERRTEVCKQLTTIWQNNNSRRRKNKSKFKNSAIAIFSFFSFDLTFSGDDKVYPNGIGMNFIRQSSSSSS